MEAKGLNELRNGVKKSWRTYLFLLCESIYAHCRMRCFLLVLRGFNENETLKHNNQVSAK